MNTTITLGDAGLILIGIGILILIFYCICFVRSLIPAVKTMTKILEDANVISGIAAESTQDVQKVIGDVTESVGNISEILKGNQSIVAALTSIVNALASLKNLLKKS